MGYSLAGINNLRPSNGSYNLSALIHHKEQLTPYVLDPKLEMYEELYAAGLAEAQGFKPNDNLKAKREIAVNKLKAQAIKVDKVLQKSNRVESKKRATRDLSVSSTASTSTEKESRQSSSQTGGKLSYENTKHALLDHTNDRKHVREILDNRQKNSGNSGTGTCIVNDSEPLRMYTTTIKKSEAKYTRPYNPQGSAKITMVYSKTLEDGAVRPNEFKVWCEQCYDHHPVHNQDDMKIIYVTKDPEVAKGSKFHSGEPRDASFKDRLLKAGITASQTVHIEFVDIHDGGHSPTT